MRNLYGFVSRASVVTRRTRRLPRPVVHLGAALRRVHVRPWLPDPHEAAASTCSIELVLEQAVLVDLAVDLARPDQLLVDPARCDPAVLEHDQLVRERDRRKPVGDDDRRPPLHHLAQPEPDVRLGRRVHRGRGVVEDEDARVDDQGAGDRDPLALPARERDPAFADDGVVAVRELGDELVRLREPRRLLDLLVGRLRSRRRRCSPGPCPRRGTGPAR